MSGYAHRHEDVYIVRNFNSHKREGDVHFDILSVCSGLLKECGR